MSEFDSQKARAFAVEVVKKLRDAGFESVWAGGCVRDQLLGEEPKDYDVATNAEPDAVRDLFGRRRTLAMGAAFGVITVVGSKAKGSIEIATFRRDANYSDGRHPDAVEFSSAEEDARRRDFTINGLFYDPLEDRVIDYVGGQEDLAAGWIRAIGSATDRIAEDKLRMIRAVRFAAKLGFRIEDATFGAIRQCAPEIHVVSPERIGAEMRRILLPAHAARGLRLMQESGLLAEIAPALLARWPLPSAAWQSLEQIASDRGFCECLAVVSFWAGLERERVEQIGKAWRLSNEEVRTVTRCVETVPAIFDVDGNWPTLQRALVQDVDAGGHALAVARAVADGDQRWRQGLDRVASRLAAPRDQWDPAPLLNGGDLKQLGLVPGPVFKQLLERVRDEQLQGRVSTRNQAMQIVERWRSEAT